ALQDRPDQPVYIETARKRGYRFVARVSDDRADAMTDSPRAQSPKIVGRDAALAGLEEHLEQASRGQRQLVFVTGDAGIGKTTLVDTFHQRIDARRDLVVARGQCVEGFGGKEAYYPILEACAHFLRESKTDVGIETLARLAPTWLIQFPALVKPEQKDTLQ